MKSAISRRTFLKGSTAAAAGLLMSAAAPQTIRAAASGQPLATLIDVSKCVGCEECVAACSEANATKYPNLQEPIPKMYPPRSKPEDWSTKQDVTHRLTPYNWTFIQSVETEYKGETVSLTMPRRCMHCSNPPCVKLCPWGAAKQLPNGISRIDADVCLGGSKCRKVCPWDIPQRQSGVGLYLDILPSLAGNGVMYKCDRCYDRIAAGEQPACIDACPEGAQTIGPRDQIIESAHRLAKETNGYIYGETENGGTNTIYVSPVPPQLWSNGLGLQKRLNRNLKPRRLAMSDSTKMVSPARYKASGWLFTGVMFFLVLTGFGQMPVFKRYYVADIPGLGWLAQFYVTHYLHYLGGAILLLLIGYWVVSWLLERSPHERLSPWGSFRLILLSVILLTGLLLAVKNFNGYFYPPAVIIAFDLIHLGLVMIWLFTGLAGLILRKRWLTHPG